MIQTIKYKGPIREKTFWEGKAKFLQRKYDIAGEPKNFFHRVANNAVVKRTIIPNWYNPENSLDILRINAYPSIPEKKQKVKKSIRTIPVPVFVWTLSSYSEPHKSPPTLDELYAYIVAPYFVPEIFQQNSKGGTYITAPLEPIIYGSQVQMKDVEPLKAIGIRNDFIPDATSGGFHTHDATSFVTGQSDGPPMTVDEEISVIDVTTLNQSITFYLRGAARNKYDGPPVLIINNTHNIEAVRTEHKKTIFWEGDFDEEIFSNYHGWETQIYTGYDASIFCSSIVHGAKGYKDDENYIFISGEYYYNNSSAFLSAADDHNPTTTISRFYLNTDKRKYFLYEVDSREPKFQESLPVPFGGLAAYYCDIYDFYGDPVYVYSYKDTKKGEMFYGMILGENIIKSKPFPISDMARDETGDVINWHHKFPGNERDGYGFGILTVASMEISETI